LIAILPVTAAPLQVEVVQGDGAIHNVRGRQFVEPVVQVLDAGQPVEGAIVSFLLPQVGPSGRFVEGPVMTLATGPDGVAAARGFRPNTLPGQFEIRVTASWKGRTGRATLLQTNAAPIEGGVARRRSRTFVILGVLAGGAAAGAAAALGGSRPAAAAAPSPAPQPPAAILQPPATIAAGAANVGSPAP
jgi:hypothetical protein